MMTHSVTGAVSSFARSANPETRRGEHINQKITCPMNTDRFTAADSRVFESIHRLVMVRDEDGKRPVITESIVDEVIEVMKREYGEHDDGY